MAEPFQRSGTWYARVKDAAGRWRNVTLAEARTKAQARELAADLALRSRRQRDGLELPPADKSLTVGKLICWWLDTYVAGGPSERRECDRFRLYFESTDLVRLPVAALTSGRLELFLQEWSQKGLAPASVNKLRAMVRTAFNRARRAGLVHGENPAFDTKPRKVPKRAPAFLEPQEVARLLSELGPADRPLVATALYAGLRKGELFGLRKSDVDLKRRLLMVRRSYDRETTKGAREEAVTIAAALVPFLEEALNASKGPLLFPRADGEMRTEEDKLGKRLRSALNRAGIVDGYVHLCRRCKRNGAPHEETHPDCERRRCPKCEMLLWPKPIPRRFRLHDTRHTTATLLLSAGVDLYAVARILRHTDPKITFETYAHLVPGYLHAQIDRLPKFAALVLHDPPNPVEPPRRPLLNRPDSREVPKARLEGVEPPARGFEGRCSIQLSYRRVSLRILSRRHFFWRRSCAGPSARVRFSAVFTSDTWEKACGKLPTRRFVRGSYSSERSPTSLQSPVSRWNSASASSRRPCST